MPQLKEYLLSNTNNAQLKEYLLSNTCTNNAPALKSTCLVIPVIPQLKEFLISNTNNAPAQRILA